MRFALLATGWLVAACGQQNGTLATPSLDEASYATYVHPILEARCGTLDCHGAPDRPLRLYAESGLRMRDDLRTVKQVTADELAANVRSLAAVDPGAPPAESLTLSKPLAGGVDHAGGVVWASPDDPEPACVRGWLAGASADADVISACAEADRTAALPPPP